MKVSTARTSWNSLDMCSPKTAYRQTQRKLKTWSTFRHHQQRQRYAVFWDDQLLFEVHSGLRHRDRALTQAYPQRPIMVLDRRARRAVSQLKEALVTAPVTAYFNPEEDTEISVDASPVGLAAILSQVDPKTDDRHVVTYASRSLKAMEQRYRQTEREALAVVWTCEHLHLYVYGKPVTIYTDHKPLVSIYSNPSSKPPARIKRWALRLQPYQITVKYRREEVNPADYLSQHPIKHAAETSRQQKVAEEYVSYLASTSTPKALKTQDIETATQSDATLQAVAEAIQKGNWHYIVKRPGVDIEEFCLLERVKDELTVTASGNLILRGTRIVIPKTCFQTLTSW